MIALRPYQLQAVEDLRAAFRKTKRVCFVLPCGAGKTICVGRIAAGVHQRGKRALMLVHRRELVTQTVDKFARFGIKAGVIAAGFEPDPDQLIQVASVQTLASRKITPPADLVVIDEGHHLGASTWAGVLAGYPDAYHLGLTATPERLDGKGLRSAFDVLVQGPTVAELVAQGALAGSRILTVPPPDLSGIKTVAGDYAVGALAQVMSQPTIVGLAVEHYLEHAAGKPAIAFCVSVEHAQQMARRFSNAGVRAASVDGTMDVKLRDEIIGGLASGRFQVVTSCALISEGLDIPSVQAAILLRPTKSLAMAIQQIGRAMRPKPDGSKAIILDHAGLVRQHGHPETPRTWSLDGRKAREKVEREATDRQERETAQARLVLETNQKLVEMGMAPEIDYAAVRGWPLRRLLEHFTTEQELRLVARVRQYKPAWVYHQLGRPQPQWWGRRRA